MLSVDEKIDLLMSFYDVEERILRGLGTFEDWQVVDKLYNNNCYTDELKQHLDSVLKIKPNFNNVIPLKRK